MSFFFFGGGPLPSIIFRIFSHDIPAFTKKNFFFSHSVLADDSAGKSGDLYIRSVCFSPDGKYLATGAEDKQIRVRFFSNFSLLSLVWGGGVVIEYSLPNDFFFSFNL